MNGRAGGGGGSESDWSREWRAQISKEVESSADKHEKTAVIQERMLGMLNDHDRRLGVLESKPDKLRADLGTYGGCSSQLLGFALMAFDALVGIAGLIMGIVAFFHH